MSKRNNSQSNRPITLSSDNDDETDGQDIFDSTILSKYTRQVEPFSNLMFALIVGRDTKKGSPFHKSGEIELRNKRRHTEKLDGTMSANIANFD